MERKQMRIPERPSAMEMSDGCSSSGGGSGGGGGTQLVQFNFKLIRQMGKSTDGLYFISFAVGRLKLRCYLASFDCNRIE